MRTHAIAVIPGDGIGQDVIEAGLRVIRAAEEVVGDVKLEFETFPWSCGYYLEHGKMMPDDGIKILEPFDAIYLGAVGFPKLVPDHISLWGLLLPIRKGFDLYVNQRPIWLLPGTQGTQANHPPSVRLAPNRPPAVVHPTTKGPAASRNAAGPLR